MVTVPADTPVTTPLPEPIVATAVLLVLQVPPVVASLKVVVAPAQTDIVPVMDCANEETVMSKAESKNKPFVKFLEFRNMAINFNKPKIYVKLKRGPIALKKMIRTHAFL